MNPASDPLGALVVCDEHQDEVLEFVSILQGLTITQNGLTLLTLVFEALMHIPTV